MGGGHPFRNPVNGLFRRMDCRLFRRIDCRLCIQLYCNVLPRTVTVQGTLLFLVVNLRISDNWNLEIAFFWISDVSDRLIFDLSVVFRLLPPPRGSVLFFGDNGVLCVVDDWCSNQTNKQCIGVSVIWIQCILSVYNVREQCFGAPVFRFVSSVAGLVTLYVLWSVMIIPTRCLIERLVSLSEYIFMI